MVIIDRKEGKVLSAEGFRLPNRSTGNDSSTGAEAETVISALRHAVMRTGDGGGAVLVNEGGVLMSTDNKSTVEAADAHAFKKSALGKRNKLGVSSEMRKLADLLMSIDGRVVSLRHGKHEHGRPAEGDRRGLVVGLNRCCDSAADAAAKWLGLHEDGSGDQLDDDAGAFMDERGDAPLEGNGGRGYSPTTTC